MMQDKTHCSPSVETFHKNFGEMKKIVQNTKSVSVENPYFPIQDTRMFASLSKHTKEPPVKPRSLLIKSLKLTNVLSHMVLPTMKSISVRN